MKNCEIWPEGVQLYDIWLMNNKDWQLCLTNIETCMVIGASNDIDDDELVKEYYNRCSELGIHSVPPIKLTVRPCSSDRNITTLWTPEKSVK